MNFPRPKDSFPKEPFGSEKRTVYRGAVEWLDDVESLQPQQQRKDTLVLFREVRRVEQAALISVFVVSHVVARLCVVT
jgi:hypothetical protein